METYILKPGQEHHGFKKAEKEGEPDVRHLFTGDDEKNNRVELTEVQFLQLKDKFMSEKSQDERKKLEKAAQDARDQLEQARSKLAESGINLDDLLVSTAKPTPVPSAPEHPSYAVETDPETMLKKEASYAARAATAADERSEVDAKESEDELKSAGNKSSQSKINPPDVSNKK